MTSDEAKRHLLNHMSYSNAYFAQANRPVEDVDPVALCEAASHAMACMFALVDGLADDSLDPGDLAIAMEGIANRWIAAIQKWQRKLPSNRAAAYAAPIRERKAWAQWPK